MAFALSARPLQVTAAWYLKQLYGRCPWQPSFRRTSRHAIRVHLDSRSLHSDLNSIQG